MAIPHIQPGEVVTLDTDASSDTNIGTRTLFKTPHMEVIRKVLAAGKSIGAHKAPGELIVQGISGRVEFQSMGKTLSVGPGELVHLSAAEPHSVHAPEDCCFLLTIVFTKAEGGPVR
jgi:quercetin dioxygenase-like cupin family protein